MYLRSFLIIFEVQGSPKGTLPLFSNYWLSSKTKIINFKIIKKFYKSHILKHHIQYIHMQILNFNSTNFSLFPFQRQAQLSLFSVFLSTAVKLYLLQENLSSVGVILLYSQLNIYKLNIKITNKIK